MADGELVNVLLKRATSNDDSYSGSLGSFLNNAASTVLSSSLVSNAVADVLNALNDTGFWFMQRKDSFHLILILI